jgi:hypothetical protein
MRLADLVAVAHDHRWLTSPDPSRALVQTTYAHVVTGTPLWRRDQEFEIAGVAIMSS